MKIEGKTILEIRGYNFAPYQSAAKYGIIHTVKTSGDDEPKGESHQPSWNTTVVAERRCARKGNMFQKAARLDCRMGGQSIERDIPF